MTSGRKFSRRDALVLALLGTLVLTVLFSALRVPQSRSRESARRSDCRANLYNIGLALARWRRDHGGNYPVTIEYDFKSSMICDAWGRLYSEGYGNDEDIYVCPSRGWGLSLADPLADRMWTANAATLYALLGAGGDPAADYDSDHRFVVNSDFNYDNGRIDKNSAAGRVVAGDAGCRQWMRNVGVDSLDSPQDWEHGGVGPNHQDGANVLFEDGAAAYCLSTLNWKYWIPHQADAMLAGSTTSLETEPDRDASIPGPDRPCLGGKYDWVRRAVFPTMRIEEDGLIKGSDDHDDIYAVEGVPGNADTPDQWWMLSEFQFETGILVGGTDWVTDGHGRITDTKGSTDGMVRVTKSKIDASIQPPRHYRPGTGRPDDARPGAPCDFGLPIGAHVAGDIWSY